MVLGPLSKTSNDANEDTTIATLPAHNIMIDRLLATPDVEATLATSIGVKEAQLQKLVVNAMINPLTTIFRCKNGQLFDKPSRLALMKVLLEETGQIVRALHPAKLETSSVSVLTDEILLEMILRVAEKTGECRSSMLQDVEAERPTEIDYINGYLVKQAKRLGLPCVNNSIIVDLVRQRRVIQVDELQSIFEWPLVERASASLNGLSGRQKGRIDVEVARVVE